MTELTHEKLLELIDYNPETGKMYWKTTRGWKCQAGQEAGCKDYDVKRGEYRWKIRVFGRIYRRSRLVWFYVHGKWPENGKLIDHIDKSDPNNTLNDRITNLREATHTQNGGNSIRSKKNSSGFKGICWKKDANKWLARICVNYKRIHLGYFDTPEAAYEAYCNAAKKYFGEFACFG
jgi:hypothetical protein